MRRLSILAVLVAVTSSWLGCASAPTRSSITTRAALPPEALAPEERAARPAATEADAVAEVGQDAEELEVAFDPEALAGLPSAPWSAAPLASDAAPGPVLAAWAGADNRATCAPIAPARLGTDGRAHARVSQLLEDGWAVEFDRPGLPGMTEDGESCARCGRGVFGIAGTAMSPEQLVGEGQEADLPPPSFADGSHVTVEPPAEGEQVAAATLTVRGQSCVYQVWSFLGEAHVRELVSDLRIVEVPRGRATRVAAR